MHHRRAGGLGSQPADGQAAHHRRAPRWRDQRRNNRNHRADGVLRRNAGGGQRLPGRQRDFRRTGRPTGYGHPPAPAYSGASAHTQPRPLRPGVSPRERPGRRAGEHPGGPPFGRLRRSGAAPGWAGPGTTPPGWPGPGTTPPGWAGSRTTPPGWARPRTTPPGWAGSGTTPPALRPPLRRAEPGIRFPGASQRPGF